MSKHLLVLKVLSAGWVVLLVCARQVKVHSCLVLGRLIGPGGLHLYVGQGDGHGLLSSSKLAWAHELGGRRISSIKRGQVIYLDSNHLQKYKNIFLW